LATNLETTLTDIVKMIEARTSTHGFIRSRLALRKRTERSTALIAFQSSTGSTKERLLFTVNLGILFHALLDGPLQQNPSVWDAHLRLRLGNLLPERSDKWWELTPGTDALALGANLTDAIEHQGVPYLEQFLVPEAMIALWETGVSPGLTDVQRLRFLERLKARLAS
jgi:hypothetical protein